MTEPSSASKEAFHFQPEWCRDFLEATPDAVVIVDQGGKIVRVNGEAEKMFGHGREELIGQEVEILMPERFRDSHRDQRADFVAHPRTRPMGMRPDLELWGLRKDGSEFPVEISLSPVPDHQGILIASIVRDVTERRRTEAALLDSEVRYRRLFETAKDGILILDTQTGKITDANPFMSELLAYPHDHFLGKQLWEIGLFSDKSANEAAVRKLQEKGYIHYENLSLETKDGRRVEVEVVANAYRENHHGVIQCNIRDITERSRLEKQMQEQALALVDLHSRKDEFLAMLSHELRNPLAPITNALHLLRLHKNKDQLQHQAHTIIERQVGQLTRLVDDLLEISRITTGRIHLQQERVALNGIVEQGVETVRTLISKRRHALKLSLPTQPIWVYADASRLEQVVVNLLTNAAKFTADGGHISLVVEQEGNEAVLRVRDTGVGIAPELLPRIFDLFTQAERSLDRSQGGLGIGLCLVQRLVELHGGRVEVYSVLGQGSEFVVRLPVMATPAPEPPSTDKETADLTGPSLRVLVVDDNVDAARALAMLLKASGHDVRTIYDGLTALDTALDYRPNVILLDIGLPGLDGFEVAKRVRQQPVISSVVLVAMTGYGQESDRQRSLDAGFNHHLVKPADFGKVQQILATVSEQAT
jgi:PAS domain S-box-containing protein